MSTDREMDDPTIALAAELISCSSVTPHECGIQAVLFSRLERLGFHTYKIKIDEVKSFWAEYGTQGPLFVFAGHTDVVPAGDLMQWASAPFEPVIREGKLYGRGAADMKGSLAAMITALEAFFAENPPPDDFSLGLLIAGDEESDQAHGTLDVLRYLEANNKKIAYCIVGEPSSEEVLADAIKVGRRGSLIGRLEVRGVQGHVAYPQRTKNPIQMTLPALCELMGVEWDRGSEYFSPTSLQITELKSGEGVSNLIPGKLEARFNLRYIDELTPAEIKKRCDEIFKKHALDYQIEWRESAHPFLTKEGMLTELVSTTIREVLGFEAQLTTSGGTSDARYIAAAGAQVIELGLLNETIHQANECAAVEDIKKLSELYRQILENFKRAMTERS